MITGDIWDIEITEITDPSNFLAVRCREAESLSSSKSDFSQWMEKMNSDLNTIFEQGSMSHRPQEGEICATLSREDNCWHRVRLESWLKQDRGQYARCYFIDNGTESNIPVQRLMKLPNKYADIPAQVFHCCLWGIQPVTLKMKAVDDGLVAEKSTCITWDRAASQIMEKKCHTYRKCKAELKELDKDGKHHVCLYFKTKHGPVCLNDVLVQKDYAAVSHQQGQSSRGADQRPTHDYTSVQRLSENIPTACGSEDVIMPALVAEKLVEDEARDRPPKHRYSGEESFSNEDGLPPTLIEETSDLKNDFEHRMPPLIVESAEKDVRSEPSSSFCREDMDSKLKPSVAANLKNYLSSPERHHGNDGNCSQADTPGVKCNMTSATPGYQSPVKMQLPPSSPASSKSPHSGSHSPTALSNFITGRGRALLLSSVSKKPGHLAAINQSLSAKNEKSPVKQNLSPRQNLSDSPPPLVAVCESLISSKVTSDSPPQDAAIDHSSPHSNLNSTTISTPDLITKNSFSPILKASPDSLPDLVANDHWSDASLAASIDPEAHLRGSPRYLSSAQEKRTLSEITKTSKTYKDNSSSDTSLTMGIGARPKRSPGQPFVSEPEKTTSDIDSNQSLRFVSERSVQSSCEGAAEAGGTRARYRRSGDFLMERKGQTTAPGTRGRDFNVDGNTASHVSLADLRDDVIRQDKGQLQGKKLLESLRESSGLNVFRDVTHPLTLRSDQPVPRPLYGVLVNGKSLPVITCDVSDVHFHTKVKEVLERKLEVETARSIQAYVWPAAISCRHVVGVCPPGKGKTMAYVPALVSLLCDTTGYIELPQGKGPLALIVVPTSRKARDVLELVECFTKEELMPAKRLRPLVLYAGGTEDREATHLALLRGCEILITTPASVLRMHKEELTSFRRLCHVVLDDADILASRFPQQVEEIIQLYRLVFKERRYQAVPRQVMMFASYWTDGLDHFRRRYTLEPIIAIASRVEAAVYGGIKQVVIMSKWDHRLSKLCSLLDTLAHTTKRVVAFSSDVSEANEMWMATKSRSIYCLLIHHDLPQDAIEEARAQWLHSSHTKQLLVMVCTDQCYQDLAITNATDVIHYGLPDSKTKFGNRLACMLDYFRDRTTDAEPELEAVSHVILTEKCAPRAEQLYEIVRRCPSDYPPQLHKFLHGYKQGIENDERKSLCPLLKAFGICIAHENQDRCSDRHLVLPKQDFKTGEVEQNWLPDAGQVTIMVEHVVTAGRYYCNLVSHQGPGETTSQDMRLPYLKLSMDLITFYSKTANHVPYLPNDDPFHDGLCAFKDKEGVFARAKVLEVHEGTRSSPMKQCRVWLVDSGRHKYGTIDQLLQLPRGLAEVPYQALEVYLCCVKPMDGDREWTDQAGMHVHKLVEGKQLVGRIMLRVGLTLWLLPLVHQVKLKEVGVTSNISLRQELLDNKFALKNPDHMKFLYKLLRGKTKIPETLMRQYFDYCLEIELTQETLDKGKEFSQVVIAAIISPGLFYIHRDDRAQRLEELEQVLEAAVKEEDKEDETADGGSKVDKGITLEQGSVCLALSTDGRWYRAKIVSDCNGEGSWEVFFLDYGDREWLPASKLRGLPRSVGHIPCQAIECQLAHISYKGGDWPEGSADVMCDLAYFVNQEKKLLHVKVVDSVESNYSMGRKLVVDVYETLREKDLSFSHELIKRHKAVVQDQPQEGDIELKPILGKPALKNQRFFNPLDKIAYLAANLYWAETSSETLPQAQELKSLLSLRIKGWDKALDQRAVLPSVVKVVSYVPDVTAHSMLLEALTQVCVDSLRLCNNALDNGLLERLLFCVEQQTEPALQTQAAAALAQLVTQDRFCEECLTKPSLVLTLEQLLGSHSKETPVRLEVLKHICSAASHLVHVSQESLPEMCCSETITVIVTAINQAVDEASREPWLQLLAAIATKDITHSYLMRQANITTVLQLLPSSSCPKVLYYCLSVCLSLAETSRKHKTKLLERELLITLNRMLERGLPSPAQEIGERLQSFMTLQLPAPEVLSGVPANTVSRVEKTRYPEVLWSQNCFRLILEVMVRGAREENFSITSDRISFQVDSEDTRYEFDWELYDMVCPHSSKVDSELSKVIVSLKKKTKGQWSRPYKDKKKLYYVKANLDRLYNSDSDAEEVEDDANLTKLTEKKLPKGQGFHPTEGHRQVRKVQKFDSSDMSSDDLAVHSSSDYENDPNPDLGDILSKTAR